MGLIVAPGRERYKIVVVVDDKGSANVVVRDLLFSAQPVSPFLVAQVLSHVVTATLDGMTKGNLKNETTANPASEADPGIS